MKNLPSKEFDLLGNIRQLLGGEDRGGRGLLLYKRLKKELQENPFGGLGTQHRASRFPG